jgi:signal transduction histidine kinase/HD-like signal output (HDOD) protein
MLDGTNSAGPGFLSATGKHAKLAATVLDLSDIRQRLPAARLPVLPQVLDRLLDACTERQAGADELAAIASLDPGIAARVITVASASMDELGGLSNLAQCVAAAGANAVKAIAIHESAASVFGRAGVPEATLRRNWAHALKCAVLAKALAGAMHYADIEEAYLAGLMHDVGSLALAAIDPDGYPALYGLGRDDEHLCGLELERYQVTHADVGAWITEKWQLGSFLSDSILYHHVPAERVATAHPLIRIVLLANHLAQLDPSADLGGAHELARLCGAPPESVLPALQKAHGELARIAGELGVGSDTADASATQAGPALPGRPADGLHARLEKKLLIDGVRCLLEDARTVDAVLKGTAQAALILFGLQASVFFLREKQGEAFAGRALPGRHAKVSQLRFFAGQSDSAVSMATLGTPMVWFDRDGWRKPLDSQLARLLGTEGVICIPMGGGPQCRGLVVAALGSRHQAELLHGRMDMLRAFGTLAGNMVAAVLAEEQRGLVEAPADIGATRAQIRHMLHEVSTPLTIVRNYLATLKISLGQQASGEKELRIVGEEIDRVTQILEHFRQSPGAPAAASGPLELQELVQGLLDLCTGAGLVPPQVRIDPRFGAVVPTLIPNPDPLKQVLLNLMKNALEAMPDGGVLRVSTARWSDGGDAGAGGHVEITVEDTGPGLPEEVLRNIYKPVASSKGGQHFGIGLSIAGQLVREMNGLIHCHSDRNGCRFRIILPLGTP